MKKKKIEQKVNRSSATLEALESYRYTAPIAFGAIALALTFLFREFIFSSDMLYGSDMLSAGIFFRSYFVDFVLQHGSIPQWNPYIFCGMPFVDAFHGDLFYPLSFFKFFGSLHRMLGLILVFHIFLAGVFMYFCARQFRLAKVSSLLAGICYMFSPFLVSLVAPGHDGKIFVTTLFPLAMLFLDRGFNTKEWISSLFSFSLMGLIIGLIILSPHAQMSYFTLWALGSYTLYRLIRLGIKKKNVVLLIRPATLAAFAVLIGLGLSAIQFYPGYTYTNEYSPRADAKKGWEWATSWSMHEEEAFSLVVPEFVGTSTKGNQSVYWGKNFFKDNSDSVGVVSIFLALLGLFFARIKHKFFFGGMALIALLYALGATTPIFSLFFAFVPKVSSLRAPSMIMFLFSFSISLLAGMCFQWVLDSFREKESSERAKKVRNTLIAIPASLLVLALAFSMAGQKMLGLWTSMFFSDARFLEIQKGITKLDAAYMNLSAIQSGTWFAFLFVAAAAAVIWMMRSGKRSIGIVVVLLLIPIINDSRFDQRFIETVDPKPYWEENAVVNFLKSQPGYFRVMGFARVVSENYLPQFGISVVTGYHGNQLRWFDHLLGGPGAPNQGNRNLLNLVGAQYIIIPGNTQMPEGYFGNKPVTMAAQFGQVNIVHNQNALPRAFLVDQYRMVPDQPRIVKAVLDGTDDLSKIVYLEEEPPIEIAADSLSTDSVWIVNYEAELIELSASVAKNKLMVLTDVFYDNWKAYVDGQPAKILRANGAFRAICLPKGTKSIEFRYETTRYATGRTITLSTFGFLSLVFIGWFFVRRRSFDGKELE